MSLARALYSVLTWAAQPLLLRKLRRRAVAEPGYGRAVGERFGRYARPIDSLMPQSSTDPLHSFVWIHAVSLGETRAAAILLAELRQQLPGMRLLLTHGTATGRAEGEKLLLPGDVQVWQPWDTRGAVRRFLRQFRPAIGILMETEVWPNLVAGCQQRGIPLVLANARFNATSLRKSQRLGALARPAYGGLTAVWAQTDADAERLQRMGAPVQGVFGNLKFDVVPDAAQRARGRAWRARSARPVVMLASSREGEEAMWLDVFKQNWHPALSQQASAAINSEANQRFAEVQQLLRSAGLTVSSRSQWADAPEPADVWLGDSLGEMVLYYGLADVAMLGGSFAPLGGQNLIEAIACGCPVVLGPHTFNFAEAATLACEQGVAHRVADIGQGVQQACDLATDAPRLAAARGLTQDFTLQHRGAARLTATAIRALLGIPATP
ncbi:MAG: 3-deoxy-D-manno-octulosonic acid transferase [Acidovorax sp. 32-64-7]|nr:MAG: 3-deoxy-D-manno-octulosonic acid transferase [Acidovorax sp. 32-64-7]